MIVITFEARGLGLYTSRPTLFEPHEDDDPHRHQCERDQNSQSDVERRSGARIREQHNHPPLMNAG
jgi:hypothetical protein